jgi:hypothetical protein
MIKIAMSAAASAVLRALLLRADVARDRILLTNLESMDWQSLTLVGERHQIELRIPGPRSGKIADRLCAGLEDAEFDIPGQIVADIAVRGEPVRGRDGSITVAIEALTIAE